METIYLDSEFRCSRAGAGELQIETDVFSGKCDKYVEGFRYVPEGHSWTREDGQIFSGLMIAPWKDLAVLQAYQEQYETMAEEIADMQTALNMLEVYADG